MVDATYAPGITEGKQDLESRLDRIFSEFWRKLEERMHQHAQTQPTAYSSQKRIPTLQHKSTAAATMQAPTRRQSKTYRNKAASRRVPLQSNTRSVAHSPTVAPGFVCRLP
ncbi:Hypothetical predicted protein [Pelobates cultripes]|uniref:Uncharacterized protein n=1 Tax=Pelobates cultripes TaxID=61616 RepID=A0AAD1SGV8_PELCU|nr:Hypothetical predicted protein [Pelobates cultripes]